MTKSQAVWASKHDWFVRAVKDWDGEYLVFGRTDVLDTTTGEWDLEDIHTKDFQELRAWAGY